MYTNSPLQPINRYGNQKFNYVDYYNSPVWPMVPAGTNKLATTPCLEQAYLNVPAQPSPGNTNTWYAQKTYPDLED